MPRASYPRPWVATGHGSYRELRAGEFELKFRDENGQRHLIVPCTAEEAEALIEIRTRNRRRIAAGLPAVTTWDNALVAYEKDLQARGVKEGFRKAAQKHLKSLRDSAAQQPANVQTLHVQNWLNDYAIKAQAKGNRGWRATTNELRLFALLFFRWMKRAKLITENPVEDVLRLAHVKRPNRDLTMEEFKRLRRVCEPSIRDLLLFMAVTGVRIGEVINMRRADIDDKGVWNIPKRKKNVPLKINLSDRGLLDVVFRQKPDASGRIWRRWVRPNPKGKGCFEPGSPIDAQWFRNVIHARCALAKIPPFSAHALRHAKASWHDELGIDLRVTQRALGHTSISTTQRYAHGQMQTKVLEAQEKVMEHVKDAPAEARLFHDDEDLGDAREA